METIAESNDNLPEYKEAPILDAYLTSIIECKKNPNAATALALKEAGVTAATVGRIVHKNKKYISQKVSEYLKECDIDKLKVMSEIKNMASSNIADYAEFSNGTMTWKEWKKLSRAELACIKEVKVTTDKFGDKNVQFVLYDKQKSLSDLVKILELSTDVIEHKGHITHGPRLFDKE